MSSPDQAPGEETPLLDDVADDSRPQKSNKTTWGAALSVVVLISALNLVLDFAGYLTLAPQLQIFEKILCRDYYAAEGLLGAGEHTDCKIKPIQAELALINGWKDTFEIIPGLLLAVPYGAFADRIGRKPILLLGMIGCLLGDVFIKIVCWFSPSIPLRAVWFSALFQLIGGGPMVASSMMYAMIADVCPAEKRSTAFAQLTSAILISEIAATPIAAALMPINPWLPLLIGLGISIFGTILALFLPETLNLSKQIDQTDSDPASTISAVADEPSHVQSLSGPLLVGFSKFHKLAADLAENSTVILILFTFFVSALGSQASSLVLQYASERYHWSIAEASYLVTLRGSVTLLLLMVLLPSISAYLVSRQNLDAATRDKRLTQFSLLIHVCGFVLVFFASRPWFFILGLTIFSLGSSFGITARSLISALVKKEALGTVYTAIVVITSVGMLIAGPLMAYAFRWGMILGNIWVGLPFLAASLLFTVAFIFVSLLRLNAHGRQTVT